MNRPLCNLILWFTAATCFMTIQHAEAQYAKEVVSYDPGTTPAIDFESLLPYDLTSSALGEPSRFIDDPMYPGVVSPFNAPYKRNQLLSVGETGQVTLRLSNYALPQPGGKEIGVFTHVGIVDLAFLTGQAGSPAAPYSVDYAFVEMSADGIAWFPVGVGETTFDKPTNGYLDVTNAYNPTPGSVESDFQEPFVSSLNSFDGLPYYDGSGPDILEVLGNSGGGNWLDIPLGLTQVGFVRFTVEDNGDPEVGLNFELDAISVASAAMGSATVPEPASLGLAALALAAGTMHLRRHRCDCAT